MKNIYKVALIGTILLGLSFMGVHFVDETIVGTWWFIFSILTGTAGTIILITALVD